MMKVASYLIMIDVFKKFNEVMTLIPLCGSVAAILAFSAFWWHLFLLLGHIQCSVLLQFDPESG